MRSNFSLLFVFVLCALQSIAFAASVSDKLLDILGTENETVENVQLILKSGDPFNHSLLEIISKCKNMEVASEIYFTVYHSRSKIKTQGALKNTINKIFLDFDGKVEEGGLAHKLIDLCLQHSVIQYDCPEFFELITTASLLQGNFKLLNSFLAARCTFPKVSVSSVKESANPLEALQLCIKYLGYRDPGFAHAFFEMEEFTPEKFEVLIKEGILNKNYYMDAAMKNGRLDLAYTGYKHGLKFDVYPNGTWYNEVEFLSKRTKISEYIAVNETFPKVKLLLEALKDPESELFCIPRDILTGEICSWMCKISVQKIFKKLFKYHERPYPPHDPYSVSTESSDDSDSD